MKKWKCFEQRDRKINLQLIQEPDLDIYRQFLLSAYENRKFCIFLTYFLTRLRRNKYQKLWKAIRKLYFSFRNWAKRQPLHSILFCNFFFANCAYLSEILDFFGYWHRVKACLVKQQPKMYIFRSLWKFRASTLENFHFNFYHVNSSFQT